MVLDPVQATAVQRSTSNIHKPQPGKQQPSGIYQKHAFSVFKAVFDIMFCCIANHNAFPMAKKSSYNCSCEETGLHGATEI